MVLGVLTVGGDCRDSTVQQRGNAHPAVAIDGEPLSLSRVDGGFLDAATGLTFDVLGNDVDGSSTRLAAVEHLDTFWFAIAAFDSGVEIL